MQWIKVFTDIFANPKIKILLKERDGDTFFRVWIQLLTIAVECNRNGKLVIGNNKPMTIENFSKIMGKSKKKIEKILNKFLELEMLIKEGETFLIKNWDKYQSIEKLNKIAKLNKVIEESKNEKSFYNSTQEKIRKEENRKETRIDESNFETLG